MLTMLQGMPRTYLKAHGDSGHHVGGKMKRHFTTLGAHRTDGGVRLAVVGELDRDGPGDVVRRLPNNLNGGNLGA